MAKVRLSECTWVLGDKPGRTVKKMAGCWVDSTHTKGQDGKKGGPVSPCIVSRNAY